MQFELSVYSPNKLSYLVQKGVSGWLVIAGHNEGCERTVWRCGRVCVEEGMFLGRGQGFN